MTAKEMFAELGYTQKTENIREDAVIVYGIPNVAIISFDENKQVYKEGTTSIITLDEWRAINKQIEELGWNTDERTE